MDQLDLFNCNKCLEGHTGELCMHAPPPPKVIFLTVSAKMHFHPTHTGAKLPLLLS